MSEDTPKDTETLAMDAWLKLPEKERVPYVATSVPVCDPSSQPKPK
jgi:hypothetical protein